MGDVIEIAKTGRATCRTCRKPIAKGEARFGEEAASAYGEGVTFMWHHVACAAKKKPSSVREALKSTAVEIENRAEVEKIIEENAAKEKPSAFPYAERAPSARAKCGGCGEAIGKGELRVATERELETPGMGATTGARYWHPACAAKGAEVEGILEKVRANSRGLGEGDMADLERALGA
jgi:hypothetical protein